MLGVFVCLMCLSVCLSLVCVCVCVVKRHIQSDGSVDIGLALKVEGPEFGFLVSMEKSGRSCDCYMKSKSPRG